MGKVPGVVDLQVEPQVEIPQLRLEGRTARRRPDTAWRPATWRSCWRRPTRGGVVSTVLDGDRYFDLVVWYDESSRSDPARDRADHPRHALGPQGGPGPGGRGARHDAARTRSTASTSSGASSCPATSARAATWAASSRTSSKRSGRWRGSCRDQQGDYRIEYGGQFEAQQQANGAAARCWGRWRSWACSCCCGSAWGRGGRRLQVLLVNIPLAAVGSVVALLLVNQPEPRGAAGRPVVAVAGGLGAGDDAVGGALGRLHHAAGHRQPQRHHDDLALHPPDEARGREVQRGDGHPRHAWSGWPRC